MLVDRPISTRLRRGFSLIELIAIIVVLGVLAGVALPRFFDHADRARLAAAKGARAALQQAVLDAKMHADVEGTGDGTWPEDLLALLSTEGGKHLLNPYHDAEAGEVVHDYDFAGDPERTVPRMKTVEWAVQSRRGTIWYNRRTGIVMFRVPEQASTQATIDLFNAVNQTSVTSLNQTRP